MDESPLRSSSSSAFGDTVRSACVHRTGCDHLASNVNARAVRLSTVFTQCAATISDRSTAYSPKSDWEGSQWRCFCCMIGITQLQYGQRGDKEDMSGGKRVTSFATNYVNAIKKVKKKRFDHLILNSINSICGKHLSVWLHWHCYQFMKQVRDETLNGVG